MLRLTMVIVVALVAGFATAALADQALRQRPMQRYLSNANCPVMNNTDTPTTQPGTCPGGGCGENRGEKHRHHGHHD